MFSSFLGGQNDGTHATSSTANDDVSLHTILQTHAQRVELVLLVALTVDQVRHELGMVFEASGSGGAAAAMPSTTMRGSVVPLAHQPVHAAAGNDLISFGDEKPQRRAATAPMAAAAVSPSASVSGSARNAQDAQDALRQREMELTTPRMQALRRAAIAYFNGWQVNVLRRLGEVLNVRSEIIKQARRQYAASISSSSRLNEQRKMTQNDHAAGGMYTAIETPLRRLSEKDRIVLLQSLLLLLLSLEQYTAHSRVLLRRLTHSLGLPASTLLGHESSIARGLLSAASNMSADEATKKAAASTALDRKWKVGLATVAGAALIGVTGGLAAPILAAGFGTVMGGLGLGVVGSLLGGLIQSTVLIGGLFGAYGGRMTGQIMEKYAREIKDFKFLPIQPLMNVESSTEQHKLRVAIGISGWLVAESDIKGPWRVLDPASIEPFALRWELDALLNMGDSLVQLARRYAWDITAYGIISHTLLGALYAGLWPLGLLKCASIVDNPFSIAKNRADKAGQVLAHALMDKAQGERPVTLIGYSLGARVIYSCLLYLADHNAFGLVEQVVLMGAPTPADTEDWTRIRAVVSGRLVNVYSSDDFVLGFLYRTSSVQLGIAGLQAIEGVHGVENADVSQLVKGHMRYRNAVGQILMQIGYEELDGDEVLNEMEALEREVKAAEAKQASSSGNRGSSSSNNGHILVSVDGGAPLPSAAGTEQELKSMYEMAAPATSRTSTRRGNTTGRGHHAVGGGGGGDGRGIASSQTSHAPPPPYSSALDDLSLLDMMPASDAREMRIEDIDRLGLEGMSIQDGGSRNHHNPNNSNINNNNNNYNHSINSKPTITPTTPSSSSPYTHSPLTAAPPLRSSTMPLYNTYTTNHPPPQPPRSHPTSTTTTNRPNHPPSSPPPPPYTSKLHKSYTLPMSAETRAVYAAQDHEDDSNEEESDDGRIRMVDLDPMPVDDDDDDFFGGSSGGGGGGGGGGSRGEGRTGKGGR